MRKADSTVRRAIHRLGAQHVAGTVQQLNSLRGACLVQGVTAATLIRRNAQRTLITETHPKALLWLLGIATVHRPAKDVEIGDLAPAIDAGIRAVSEHERDSVISCIAAAAFHERHAGWYDLAAVEPDIIEVVPGGAAYWIPMIEG